MDTNNNNSNREKNEDKSVDQFEPKYLPQILAGISSNFAAIAWGTIMSWSATAVPNMSEDDEFGEITDNQSSWISSIAALGACLACIPSSFLLDYFGRRKTMLGFAPLYIGGWLLIYFSKNVSMVVIGRGITGFSGGLYSIATPTYLAETSGKKIRGMLINGYDFMISVGMLFITIVGTYTSWRLSALVCAFVPFIFLCLMFFMPESPRFLLSKGRDEEASTSLQWLRGAVNATQIQSEFVEIKENVTEMHNSVKDRLDELLKEPPVRKAFLLSLILFLFQTGTGIAAVLFNQVEIFKAAGTSLDENSSTMIVIAVSMVASVGSTGVVDRFGRRILLLSSEIILVLSLGALGAFFHIKEVNLEVAKNNLDWLPLTSLLVYMMGFCLGIGPIPYSIMPELLPQRVRGLAASIVMTTKWGVTFVMTRFFRDLRNELEDDGCYWLFASICLMGTLYIFFLIPETKQLTLEQIQVKYFHKKPQSLENHN